jgi:hypothetical protein
VVEQFETKGLGKVVMYPCILAKHLGRVVGIVNGTRELWGKSALGELRASECFRASLPEASSSTTLPLGDAQGLVRMRRNPQRQKNYQSGELVLPRLLTARVVLARTRERSSLSRVLTIFVWKIKAPCVLGLHELLHYVNVFSTLTATRHGPLSKI